MIALVLAATLSLQEAVDKVERAGADGVLIVRRGDTTLFQRAFGSASCDGRVPMTLQHRFDIGSITKVMTGVAVLKSMPLALRVGDVFPDSPEDKRGITVQQLLLHTSGLPDSIGLDETLVRRSFFLEELFKRPLESPGGARKYSNSGYTLLAAMIETRTGMTYEAYLREQVFKPAGVAIDYQRRGKLACGTLRDRAWGSTADYFGPEGPGWYLVGNGGLLATADELETWFRALWDGKILPPEQTQLVHAALLRKDRDGRRILVSSGANMIFSSLYERWPDDDVVFVLLTSDSEWPKEKLLPELRPAIIALAAKR